MLHFFKYILGTIHLRLRQIFSIFEHYPPPVGSFLILSVGKFVQFLTPPLGGIKNSPHTQDLFLDLTILRKKCYVVMSFY